MKIVVNPVAFEEEYCRRLALSFPNWGALPMYDWCFRRTVGSRAADVLLLEACNDYVAGGALTYRKLQIGRHLTNVATATGLWTMPQYRKQGFFSRIMLAMRDLARERDAELLFGIMRKQNPSHHGLVTQGFSAIPSFYLQYEPSDHDEVNYPTCQPEGGSDLHSSLSKIFEFESTRLKASAHVVYDFATWMSQFFQRPGCSSHLYELNGGRDHAIISKYAASKCLVISYLSARQGDEKSAQAIVELMQISQREKMKLLAYTTNPGFAQQCLNGGFNGNDGYIMVKQTAEHPSGLDSEAFLQLLAGGIDYQDGDKM